MKIDFRQIILVAAGAGACPLQAIEPPVESQPIPPRAMPVEESALPPSAVPVPSADAVPQGLPVPGVQAVRPYIGVILDPVPPILSGHLNLREGVGLVVTEMVAGGPAELAGLAVNDIIVSVDGNDVGTPEEVRAQVESHEVGDEIPLGLIKNGERREVKLVLGAAPELPQGLPQAGYGPDRDQELEGLLGNLPEKHAEWMRRAMEQRMGGLGESGRDGMPDNWQRDLLRRMERGMKGADGLPLGGFRAESSIRLLDERGSVEMRGADGSREVRVFDTEGQLVWEGPYNTEEDKAAVPEEIRQRIEGVNLDMSFGAAGLRLKMDSRQFKPLEEIAPPEGFDEE